MNRIDGEKMGGWILKGLEPDKTETLSIHRSTLPGKELVYLGQIEGSTRNLPEKPRF
jgi:hypothetical protein